MSEPAPETLDGATLDGATVPAPRSAQSAAARTGAEARAATETAPSPRRMFVTVGTDHHPFERLVAWAEAWAQRADGWDVQIQHGRTREPLAGNGFAFCDRDRLLELFESSDVVVCHGGPATITEARRFGHRPIVVPRDPTLGEHVDNHQQLFSRRVGKAGLVQLAETEDAFLAAVVAVSYLPRQRRSAEEVPPGVFQVGAVAERLVAQRGRRR